MSKKIPVTNVIAQPALMLRSCVIKTTGLYSFDYPVCEDYDYWLRVLDNYDFAASQLDIETFYNGDL